MIENECGFHIVEFFNGHHPDPHDPETGEEENCEEGGGMFRFVKIMEPRKTAEEQDPHRNWPGAFSTACRLLLPTFSDLLILSGSGSAGIDGLFLMS